MNSFLKKAALLRLSKHSAFTSSPPCRIYHTLRDVDETRSHQVRCLPFLNIALVTIVPDTRRSSSAELQSRAQCYLPQSVAAITSFLRRSTAIVTKKPLPQALHMHRKAALGKPDTHHQVKPPPPPRTQVCRNHLHNLTSILRVISQDDVVRSTGLDCTHLPQCRQS